MGRVSGPTASYTRRSGLSTRHTGGRSSSAPPPSWRLVDQSGSQTPGGRLEGFDKAKKASRKAASSTSCGCSSARPLPITGVRGRQLRSARLRLLSIPAESPPRRCPTAMSFLQYKRPSRAIVTGMVAAFLERLWSAIIFPRLYGTCPARSVLVACVDDWMKWLTCRDWQADAAAVAAA
eukprot:CAMPEP_0171628640 /NCGR_PEP_ID=MMETSP0990-20121206/21593_1 /TAXON_ID=483369 /ORGANISM="non described non described, Strain CCMP2098" /LENGTH=178 /DNA_ID=CAMNT_0012196935 /DNA_START=82 /DNA_END=618 /DNA_ORIENTATION=-